MNYKRIRGCPNQDFNEDCQSFVKKSRVENEQFLNFNDPPSFVFNNLKIPRRINDQISSNVPLMNDFVSPILPPFPGLENSCRNIDDPVTKAVIDNITGKLDNKTSKLKYYRCKPCNLTLSGQATLDDHFAGARHARKLKELELSNGSIGNLKKDKVSKLAENEFKCRVCDVKAGSLVQIKSHIDGIKHKKQIKAYREKKSKKHTTAEKLPIPNNTSSTISQDEKCSSSAIKLTTQLCNNNKSIAFKKEPTSNSFHCDVCSLCMNSQSQYDQHINSKKHSTKLAKLCIAKNEAEAKKIQAGPDEHSQDVIFDDEEYFIIPEND